MRSEHDPRPTDNLGDNEAWPFTDGSEEIVIRVSRYAGDGFETPVTYQAVVKHRDRTKVWGLGIRANPVAALGAAIEDFYAKDGRPWPGGGEVGYHREPLLDETDPSVEDLLS